jgi:DNA-binding CsgD family transcriptional regulator
MRQAGTILGGCLTALGTAPLFAVLVLLLILPSPFLTPLFDEIRSLYLDRLKNTKPYSRQAFHEENSAAYEAEGLPPDDLVKLPSGADYEALVQGVGDRCGLTPRETEVLQLALLGQTIKEMAQNLYISEVTIKSHIGRILKKTGARNRTQLLSIILNAPRDIGSRGIGPAPAEPGSDSDRLDEES